MKFHINQKTDPYLILRVSLIAAVLLISVAKSNTTYAQSTDSTALSQADAIAQAMAQNGQQGKVIGVRDKVNASGSAYFEVKILTKGKVRIFKIPK